MYDLIGFGADTAKPSAKKAPAGKVIPKGTPAIAVRDAFATDLRNAMVVCQKLGIDINRPALRRALMVTGGSTAALAAHVGPEKTLACLKMFAGLGHKYRDYIFAIEKNFIELSSFAKALRGKTGAKLTTKAKKETKMAADMGAWGTMLALGAAGAAVYFVTRQFANKEAEVQSKPKIEAAPPVVTTTVKLKDAAAKKYVDATLSLTPDGVQVFTGNYKNTPFKIECKQGFTPVWSGLRWACMPVAQEKAIAMAGAHGIYGIGRDLTDKDSEGVDTCCNGSLEEIVGDMGYSFVGAKARKAPRKVVRRKPRIPGQVPAGAIPAMGPPAPTITRMTFEDMHVYPSSVSPMRANLDPETRMILDMLNQSPQADRRYTAAVTNPRQPTIWPGSRGSYSY